MCGVCAARFVTKKVNRHMDAVITFAVSALIPLILITYFIFWVMMLVHAIRHQPEYHKVAWVLVILFVPFVGAIIYLMFRGSYYEGSLPQ
jgi:hypothetical protein